jgi:Ca2+-binding EF-hand superfamily protein
LTREEIANGYEKLGLTSEDQVDDIMRYADFDGNGYLDYQEFITAT